MRDEIDRFREAGVQPFGVNPALIASHARYAKKFGFPFPLLSDPSREVSGAYGALKSDGKRVQRTVVLVSRDGSVRLAVRGAPTPDEVLAAAEDGP